MQNLLFLCCAAFVLFIVAVLLILLFLLLVLLLFFFFFFFYPPLFIFFSVSMFWPLYCNATWCPEKQTKNVFVIFSENSSDSHDIWHLKNINLPQNYIHVFHLTWILSLHYLVKLEMLIAHVLVFSERNSRINPTSTVVSKFARLKSSWSQRVWEYCKRTCPKRASLIWPKWNGD